MFCLLDNYEAIGYDLDSYRIEAEAMDKATEVEKADFADLQIDTILKKTIQTEIQKVTQKRIKVIVCQVL